MKRTSVFGKQILPALTIAGALLTGYAQAQGEPPITMGGSTVAAQSGERIYQSVCQACHQSDAKGAQGAGFYPALAENPRLVSAAYPLSVVLHGRNGMPPLRGLFSDQQVAEVVNYVRSHFGNEYTDKVTASDVAKIRELRP